MGVENEINAISAFNLVGVEVEVEAELGKNIVEWGRVNMIMGLGSKLLNHILACRSEFMDTKT